MKKLLFILLIPFLGFSQTQIGSDIDGEDSGDQSGNSTSISNDGSVLAIGARFNDGNGTLSGHVRIYENLGGVWTQIGDDIDGEAEDNRLGWSVSISGDGSIVAIGAPTNDGNGTYSGHVRVYQNLSGTWVQMGSDINGEAANDGLGYSVSLSENGDIVAVGALFNDGNGTSAGHVRVYQYIGGAWIQVGGDIDGEAAGDNFGTSVSLSNDGTIVAIGAPDNNGSDANSGHVRVYENQSNVWVQIGNDINGEAADDQSGESVSLSGNGSIVAIGTPFNDGNGAISGHVRIYENQSGVWVQVGNDIDGEAADDRSGGSISLSNDGTIVAIGARFNNGNGTQSGHVRIYKNLSGVWIKMGDDIDGESGGDWSGSSVSLSSDGSIVSIGASSNNGNGGNSGHVRVYDLSAILNSNSFIQSSFSLHPNPVSEILIITIENSVALEKVKIYNTLGQLVKTETSNIINVSNLAVGTYYVQIITNQGNATKSIIVK